jgi:hypothetical protein
MPGSPDSVYAECAGVRFQGLILRTLTVIQLYFNHNIPSACITQYEKPFIILRKGCEVYATNVTFSFIHSLDGEGGVVAWQPLVMSSHGQMGLFLPSDCSYLNYKFECAFLSSSIKTCLAAREYCMLFVMCISRTAV